MTRAEAEKLVGKLLDNANGQLYRSENDYRESWETIISAITAPPRVEITEAAQSDFDSDLPHWIGGKDQRLEIMKAALRAAGVGVVE